MTSSKLCANYVTRKFKLQTIVVLLFMQHAKQNMHKQKAVVQNISEEAKTSKQVVVASTSTSEPKPSDVTEQEDDQRETIGGHEGSKQPLIKHFFMKTVKDTDKGQSSLLDKSKADHGEETMSLPDQICKAEALWALKTAKDDFSFNASDGFPQLLQRVCPDSEIAKGVKMSLTKVLCHWSWIRAILPTKNSR